MEVLGFSFKKAKFNHDYKEGVKTTVQKGPILSKETTTVSK